MTDSAFHFQTLKPETILDALFEQGIRVESGLTPLNSFENRVYQFQDEERQRYVVKFYRPERWHADQIEEEHQFTLNLQKNNVPVAAPIVLSQQTLFNYQGFLFAVFPSLGGRQYETDNIIHMESVGHILGQIHQIGRQQLYQQRPNMGMQEYLYQPRELFDASALIPSVLKTDFLNSVDKLTQIVEERWKDLPGFLRLHGDCHPGNILWRDGPLFVDFDDSRNGPAVQDLWMLLNGDKAEQRMQLEAIIEAYEDFTPFNIKELALIEPLRAMRMVWYLGWILRRWSDAAFPGSFPWIKDEDFWRRQTATFNEQIRVLQEPPLQLTPMY
ncbi:serine/threonine protein kinase [Apirhabdus apintestini]|uniref:serine/threonine protein kinase n=1 Tax=Erwinia sp. HR93 TaxID=3094840 RepID=UPI002ADEACA1|nr:serine/threonine protein kinase [Erwinia sp. HR93]MEA1062865.1 serine/threonine protein kinase [Erwinia sp. HR93]WPM84771.1 serine/threonine protein kinase [Enterobacteriaceae bacterium CA-0114]